MPGTEIIYLIHPERQHLQITLNPEFFRIFYYKGLHGLLIYIPETTANTVIDLICSNDDSPPMGSKSAYRLFGVSEELDDSLLISA